MHSTHWSTIKDRRIHLNVRTLRKLFSLYPRRHAEEAQEAMETILAANVVETSGGDLVEIIEARMRVTQVTVLK